MFGLEEQEVISRRRYVNHVKTEIEVCVISRFAFRFECILAHIFVL